MTSPFTLIRRYEKTMMVIVTGVAMVSFVLLGAVQNPQDIPAPLLVIFAAATLGAIAWLAGLSRGKAVEWGLSGALIGGIFGLVGMMSTREASAVLTSNGNLTATDLSRLARQRSIANSFVQLAFQNSFGISIPPQLQRQFLFGFSAGGEAESRDLIAGELLRREAEGMGMVVSDQVVMEFIKRLTSKPGLQEAIQRAGAQLDPQSQMYLMFLGAQAQERPLTREAFTKIRSQLRVSESELLDAIRNELKTVQAFELLYGRNELTPETFWEFYRQLNVKQSADVAVIPVADFIKPDMKPSELELQDLFSQYQNNTPGFTVDGQPEEGRPGFLQPRRFQIGYLEAVYDQIEPLVGEVTDEEIQKRYEERYLRTVPEGEQPKMDGPALPPLSPPAVDAPGVEAPKVDAPKMDAPPASAPSVDATEKMTPKAEEPKAEEPKKEEGKKEEPKTETPAKEMPKEDAPKPETPKTEEKPEPAKEEAKPEEGKKEEPAPESKPTSGVMTVPETSFVLFLQDEEAPKKEDSPAPAEEKKAEEKPAEEKKAEEKKPDAPAKDESKKDEPKKEMPAEPKADAPAADKPAEKADGEKKEPAMPALPPPPSEDDVPPPSPASEVPPLDDALKAEIRQSILRERTVAEIKKRTAAAGEFLSEIAYRVQQDSTEEGALTLEQATKELEKYAADHNLIYVVTPLLSYQQLSESEDYPIGSAVSSHRQQSTVAEYLYFSPPAAIYRVGQADNFLTSSGYAFWKLADKAAYAPQTLDAEPGLREQVAEAWKNLQARPKARARAEELAKQVQDSDKPMPEALAEATVTGEDGSLFVSVRSTGDFTWMNRPIVPPTSMQQSGLVSQSIIPGVEEPGADFFKTIFNDMKPGDVKVLPNRDKSAFYLVKILNRNPSTPEEMETFREDFIKAGMQQPYGSLAQRTLSRYSTDWFNDFFEQYEVVILNDSRVDLDQ